jgi:hypothetical protein
VKRAAAMWAAESIPLSKLDAAFVDSINNEKAEDLTRKVKSAIGVEGFARVWEDAVR